VDDAIVLALHGWVRAHEPVARLVAGIAEYGIFLLPITLVALWFLPASGASFRRTVLIALLPSVCLAVFLALGLGLFIDRPRPFVALPIASLFPYYPDSSFPSDHVLLGIALVGPAAWSKPRVGVWLVASTLLVGFARVAAGLHYPSDVIGSALLGAIPTAISVGLVSWLERASPNSGRTARRIS
jgi:undecaprenyl-diphosphatase